MSAAALLLRQVAYERKLLVRNSAVLFFSILLPIIFLVIFAGTAKDSRVAEAGGIELSAYYVPGIAVLGIVSTTFLNLAMGLTRQREAGILKRMRGTPLPSSIYIAGRVVAAIGTAFVLVAVLLTLGWVLYGIDVPGRTLPGLVLTVAVAAASLCCLGIAYSAAIPSEDAAPAFGNAVVLPLYFISGVFFSTEGAPGWFQTIADIFPVRHLVQSMLNVYNPHTAAPGIAWGHVGIIAAWGTVGAVLALRFFRWTPRRSG
ncbi:MAG: ABC transporter permease [Thermoleophilaceae bacterium]|nr:ABC transporter permease [Thermoleophilaceae bacterium]